MATTFKLVLKQCERQIEREVVADDIVAAIQDFHLSVSFYTHNIHLDDGTAVCYAIIGVDGYGDFISRVYRKGIGRNGGIKPKQKTLSEIADILGVNPQELEDEGWIGESDEWKSV